MKYIKNLVIIFFILIFEHGHVTDQQAVPGLPVAIIFDKKTSIETRNWVDKAIKLINTNVKYGRNKWSMDIENIDVKKISNY